MLRLLLCSFALLAAWCVGGDSADAGKFNKKLSLGDSAPAWSDLTGVDAKQHAMKDYDSKFLVLVFTCNQCPIATGYQDRLNQLARDFKDAGLTVVAINVNRGKAESLERMTKRSQQAGMTFDYLKDPDQITSKAYGARTTPTVFLLNSDRKIVYMGAFDDNWQAEEAVERHYLVDALKSAIAGKTPEVAETLATGCAISSLADEDE